MRKLNVYPERKKSKRRTSKTSVETKIITEVDEDEDEEELLGEDGELIDLAAFKFKEKEEILTLCKKITENFWDTAWAICSERFYASNAPCMMALELRDIWLRAIEVEWMDQEREKNLSPSLVIPDEPPLPLFFESPSIDLFHEPRIKTAQEEDSLQVSSQSGEGEAEGEPDVQNLQNKSPDEKNRNKLIKNLSPTDKKRRPSKIPRYKTVSGKKISQTLRNKSKDKNGEKRPSSSKSKLEQEIDRKGAEHSTPPNTEMQIEKIVPELIPGYTFARQAT